VGIAQWKPGYEFLGTGDEVVLAVFSPVNEWLNTKESVPFRAGIAPSRLATIVTPSVESEKAIVTGQAPQKIAP
jgi:hypothetical protein